MRIDLLDTLVPLNLTLRKFLLDPFDLGDHIFFLNTSVKSMMINNQTLISKERKDCLDKRD